MIKHKKPKKISKKSQPRWRLWLVLAALVLVLIAGLAVKFRRSASYAAVEVNNSRGNKAVQSNSSSIAADAGSSVTSTEQPESTPTPTSASTSQNKPTTKTSKSSAAATPAPTAVPTAAPTPVPMQITFGSFSVSPTQPVNDSPATFSLPFSVDQAGTVNYSVLLHTDNGEFSVASGSHSFGSAGSYTVSVTAPNWDFAPWSNAVFSANNYLQLQISSPVSASSAQYVFTVAIMLHINPAA